MKAGWKRGRMIDMVFMCQVLITIYNQLFSPITLNLSAMSDAHVEMKRNPIEYVDKALGKRILIKLKGRRAIKAVLKSFDDHLNLFLEESVEITHHYDKEKGAVVKQENDLDSIILRGDNVVFITLDEAPAETPSTT